MMPGLLVMHAPDRESCRQWPTSSSIQGHMGNALDKRCWNR